jgi:hypothetical protein
MNNLHNLINKIQDEDLKKEFQIWCSENIVTIKQEYIIDNLVLETINSSDAYIERSQYMLDKLVLNHAKHYINNTITENKMSKFVLLTNTLTVLREVK